MLHPPTLPSPVPILPTTSIFDAVALKLGTTVLAGLALDEVCRHRLELWYLAHGISD